MIDYDIPTSCQIKNLAIILDQYFPNKTDGIFVEIGAYNGYEWSNTWALAKLGWTGFYFEPIPNLAEECRFNHRVHDVQVFQTCVGSYDGEVDLYLDPDHPDTSSGATIDLDVVKGKIFGCNYDQKVKMTSPIVTMNTVLPNILKDINFDLLVIDVEGGEVEVLKGLNLNLWCPKMAIIETHKGNGTIADRIHADEIEKIMLGYGFREIQYDGLNSIYIR